jgi:urea transport system substrate-binding protein
MNSRRTFLKSTAVAAAIAATILTGCSKAPEDGAMAAASGETLKVGILHSLSGTMAISETTLKDTILMMIDEQN